jgi:hypothetical protein
MSMTCPDCNNKLTPGTMDGRRVVACLCGYYRYAGETTATQTTPPRPVEPKLPGLDRGIQHRTVKLRESALVQRIRLRLQREGFRVMRIGQYRADLAGNDKAAPDLFVTRIGENRWTGIEIKLPGYAPSDVRAEQQALAEEGVIVIVTSESEALEAMNG